MTEQPPSASKEALDLAERIRDHWSPTGYEAGAREIDALIAQRVSAETERWQHRDRQRLGQIERLQETVQSFQSAQAERPTPAAVVDYTERARELWQDLLDKDDRTSPPEYPEMALICFDEFRDYLSAVASERDAAAIRAFGKRVWSDTEEVAYQAGVNDTRARLREPDVREAVKAEILKILRQHSGVVSEEFLVYSQADAALTKIAEVLK